MIKTYVIDTNVLIQAPYALECFEDNNLYSSGGAGRTGWFKEIRRRIF